MILKGLEKRVNAGESLTLDDLKHYIPTESYADLQKIHTIVEDISETAHIVLISGLYETQERALALLTTHIPKYRRSLRFNTKFYQGLKTAYQKREVRHIPHDTDYLLVEIDTREIPYGSPEKRSLGPYLNEEYQGGKRRGGKLRGS